MHGDPRDSVGWWLGSHQFCIAAGKNNTCVHGHFVLINPETSPISDNADL